MKKIAFCLSGLLIMLSQLHAQDLITRKTGEDIQAKVLEISTTEVKYKRFDNQMGPTYILPIADILMIRYENGTKDLFNQTTAGQTAPAPAATVQADSAARGIGDLRMRGEQDAEEYYFGKQSGSGWTAFITVLTSPLIGLIPAAACASTEPQDKNLSYPNPELMKEYDYKNAYTQKAHKMKKRQVWSGYGIGSVFWLVLVLAIGL